MGVISAAKSMIAVISILGFIYPQPLSITSELFNENDIQIEENLINENLSYLKEEIKLPQLTGGDKQKIDLINKKIKSDILDKAESSANEAKDYFKDAQGVSPTFPYEINSKYYVTSNNKSILSFYNDYYEYLGGAHGNLIRTSYNIDKSTGKLLTLKDLFKPQYNYEDIINSKIRDEINKNKNEYFFSGNDFKGIKKEQDFYLEDKNLVLYYQLYEIAPYVKGIPEFRIPLELFDKNYIYNLD